MTRFRVIQEYEKFYFCEHIEKGYKECFEKTLYKPQNGIITKKRDYNYTDELELPLKKVNKSERGRKS
ncbi:MAG: hypothetical protein PHG03_00140 [Bacilli bacterium]|nr:hypothetical protein [Bacilli bacterium]MDD4794960.1 hypothetical protein [Bacilli bacterium]